MRVSISSYVLVSLAYGQLMSPYIIQGQDYDDVTIDLTAGTIRGRRLQVFGYTKVYKEML